MCREFDYSTQKIKKCVFWVVLEFQFHNALIVLYTHGFTHTHTHRPYSVLVKLMYLGDPCATCGLRFRDRKTADYSNHLDWHYKMNSRDKTTQRPRNWFLHPEVS